MNKGPVVEKPELKPEKEATARGFDTLRLHHAPWTWTNTPMERDR